MKEKLFTPQDLKETQLDIPEYQKPYGGTTQKDYRHNFRSPLEILKEKIRKHK